MDDDKLEQLRQLLEAKIEQLQEELQLYQTLLEILNECGYVPSRAQALPGKEFRSPSGELVARLTVARDTFKLMFAKPVPAAHPYIKYALRSLKKFAESYEGLEYSVEERDGKVTAIVVTGVTRDNMDEVRAVLEFAASRVSAAAKS